MVVILHIIVSKSIFVMVMSVSLRNRQNDDK